MSNPHYIDDCIDWLAYRFQMVEGYPKPNYYVFKDESVPISITVCLGYFICKTPFTGPNGVLCDDAIQLRERVEYDLKEIRSQNQGDT